MSENHYQILGVSPKASEIEIKTAFRKLAKLYHPDKNPQTKELFSHILLAYEILSDAKKRQRYDATLNTYKSTPLTRSKNSTHRQEDEKELKRRQYYQQHYKSYIEKQQKKEKTQPTSNYNEYKYILFAIPLAVALLMFIISSYQSPVDVRSPDNASKSVIQVVDSLKMGDAPYTSYFGVALLDTTTSNALRINNATTQEAIVCLFNQRDGTFIRCCYIKKNYYAELSQLPNALIQLRYVLGTSWNKHLMLNNDSVMGGFNNITNYFKLSADSLLFNFHSSDKTHRVFSLYEDSLSVTICSERDFFTRIK